MISKELKEKFEKIAATLLDTMAAVPTIMKRLSPRQMSGSAMIPGMGDVMAPNINNTFSPWTPHKIIQTLSGQGYSPYEEMPLSNTQYWDTMKGLKPSQLEQMQELGWDVTQPEAHSTLLGQLIHGEPTSAHALTGSGLWSGLADNANWLVPGAGLASIAAMALPHLFRSVSQRPTMEINNLQNLAGLQGKSLADVAPRLQPTRGANFLKALTTGGLGALGGIVGNMLIPGLGFGTGMLGGLIGRGLGKVFDIGAEGRQRQGAMRNLLSGLSDADLRAAATGGNINNIQLSNALSAIPREKIQEVYNRKALGLPVNP